MPQRNLRGGKAYKKGKKGGAAAAEAERFARFVGRDEDQEYARVTKKLGDRRMLCFCNDGTERVCKIRGALCRGSSKKQRIEIDDIVLVSFRDYEGSDTDGSEGAAAASDVGAAAVLASGRKAIADIILKFPRSQWRDIRKEGDIHRKLFPNDGALPEGEEDVFFMGDSEDEGVAGGAGTDGAADGENKDSSSSNSNDSDSDVDIDRI